MKNKGILALAGLGAVAFLAANNKTPEQKADLAALGFTGDNNLSVDDVIRAIKTDSSLRIALKGEPGAPGAAGATGPAGATGENIQRFGDSLLQNGAIENGTLLHWTGTTIALGEVYEGLTSLAFTTVESANMINDTILEIDNRRLYKASFFGKTTAASYRPIIRRRDRNFADIVQNGSQYIYPLGNPVFTNTSFEKKTVFFGGTDTSAYTSIGINTAKGRFYIYAFPGTTTINKLSFELVSLAEPVPYNLAFLPVGQMVYDPTTSEVGRYDGTSVVWFAA